MTNSELFFSLMRYLKQKQDITKNFVTHKDEELLLKELENLNKIWNDFFSDEDILKLIKKVDINQQYRPYLTLEEMVKDITRQLYGQ